MTGKKSSALESRVKSTGLRTLSSLMSSWASTLSLCVSKARTLDVWIWTRVRWHQGLPLIIKALHTLLIQIKGIHIRFHISLIILYMALHVHLGSKLHPYISSFPRSLLLHLLFWNISNYLGAQLFVKWSLSLCQKGIFRKKDLSSSSCYMLISKRPDHLSSLRY